MAYLDDVNRVLRDINEIPLTSAQFANARGLQAFVKEAVNRAYFDTLNENPEWSFLVQHLPMEANTQTLLHTVANETWIKLPEVIDRVDEDNIFLNESHELKFVSFDYYNSVLRREAKTGTPEYVFVDATRKSLGFYPTPDLEYVLYTSAWLKPVPLSEPTDEMVIPIRFYNVVLSKARKYAWQFRGEVDQASLANNEYVSELRKMKHVTGVVKALRMRAV